MALAGHPQVSTETKKAVLAVAEELAYRPDPALRSLARYRRSIADPTFHATLAWVHNWPSADSWRSAAVFNTVFTAAEARAQRLGYKLENFWLDPGHLSANRASKILHNRGIRGLLLVPPASPSKPIPALDWDKFCAVNLLNHSQELRPFLHEIGADHFANLRLTLQRLALLGYKRPALITSQSLEVGMISQGYISAYLGYQTAIPDSKWPPVLWHETLTKEFFAAWLKRHKPDVLMLSYALESYGRIFTWLHELGLKIPQDVGVAMLCLRDPSRRNPPHAPADLSGIDECFADLGLRSVDFLVHLLENFERGSTDMPIRKIITGRWHEGSTLRTLL